MRKVFLSYDVTHDQDLKDKFFEMHDKHSFPFHVEGHSSGYEEDSKSLDAIKDSDFVIVLCGYKTINSLNMMNEFECVRESNKPYIFLNGRRDLEVTLPENASRRETIFNWNKNQINLLYYKTFL